MGRVNRTKDSDDHYACDAFLLDHLALLFDLLGIEVSNDIAIH
jgi:hypothetical protein